MKNLVLLALCLSARIVSAENCGAVMSPDEAIKLGVQTYWGRPTGESHHLFIKFPAEIETNPLMGVFVVWGESNNHSLSATLYKNELYTDPKSFGDFVTVKNSEREKLTFQSVYGNCLYVVSGFEKL